MNQHPRNCEGPGFLRNQSYFCHGPRNNVKPNIRKLNQEERLNQDEKKKMQYALGTKIQRVPVRMFTTTESEPRKYSVLVLSRGQWGQWVQFTIAVLRNPLCLYAPFKGRNFRAVPT
jgi:hypothetical protein